MSVGFIFWTGACVWVVNFFTDYGQSRLFVLAPPILLYLAGLVFIYLSLGPLYRVTGVVVSRRYIPGPSHYAIRHSGSKVVTSPGKYELLIRDNQGEEHWIVVDKETYIRHAPGSHYRANS